MKYFANFSNILYTLDDKRQNFNSVKNIFTKIKFIQEVLDNSDIYYPYSSKESDTPEIIASKLYKNPNRYWMIMMGNQRTDAFFDFPLKQNSFERYIVNKYGSVENAQTQFYAYEKVTEITTNRNGVENKRSTVTSLSEKFYNTTTKQVESNTLPTLLLPSIVVENKTEEVEGVVVNTVVKHVFVTAYDFELRENEKKRNLRLLKPDLVGRVELEFKQLLRD